MGSWEGFPGGSAVKNPRVTQETWETQDQSWVGKIPWRRAWRPQHSCLGNPMDRGAWSATIHRVTKSQTRLKQLGMHTGTVSWEWATVFEVQFSRSVMSDSLQPHGLQHARPPCPSPTPEVHSNACPWSRWWHPTISSSVVPFSSCLQFFPASGSFPMSQLFTSGGERIGASASVLPMNIQDWSPLGWTGWISLQSKGLSRVFSNTRVQKHQFFSAQLFLWSNSHIHTWPLEKP